MDAAAFFSKYRFAAIWSDLRFGIPASITLAQAAIESSYGESNLAKTANNYFGIKAYANPRNFPTVLANDDLQGEPFRAYKNAAESFADHDYFLKKEQPRYQDLFSSHDYTAWATGLKADGYATAPNYATDIINTIETHSLDKWDWIGKNRFVILAVAILLILALIAFLLNKYTKYKYTKLLDK